MIIKKIYSNLQSFRTINFNDGFSVVLGTPKSKVEGKSHNLGKTTLVQLLDQILFGSGRSELTKTITEKFPETIIKVEIEVDGESEIFEAFYSKEKKKKKKLSKEVADKYKYFIRLQDDYSQEFQKKNMRGKDSSWKPFLMRILGFDESALVKKYEVDQKVSTFQNFVKVVGSSKIKEHLNEKELFELKQEKEKLLKAIDDLNFDQVTIDSLKKTTLDLDREISSKKKDSYSLLREVRSIDDALEHDVFVELSPERLLEMYGQMKIYFGDQLKKDFQEVSQFYKKISENRNKALLDLKINLNLRIKSVEEELVVLSTRRRGYMSLVEAKDKSHSYSALSRRLADLEREIAFKEQDVYQDSLLKASKSIEALGSLQKTYSDEIVLQIDENRSIFNKINNEYKKFMLEVMDINANISIIKKSTGNIEFLTTSSRDGLPTKELNGEMAKKISCAAFDIALRIVNNDDHGFIIHDGVIDNADENIKSRFIKAVKERVHKYEFQYIMTALSDRANNSFEDSDVVVVLSDKNDSLLLMGQRF